MRWISPGLILAIANLLHHSGNRKEAEPLELRRPAVAEPQAAGLEFFSPEKEALDSAFLCVLGYRKLLRGLTADEYVAKVPVRKAAVAESPEKHRNWWRLVVTAKGNNDVFESVDTDVSCTQERQSRASGNLAIAKAKARSYYVSGYEVKEMIPPDIDPQAQGDNFVRNTSGYQPQGLTVRQRTKKH